MAGRFVLFLLVLAAPSGGLLLSSEDNPSIVDRVLQVVWEPSSLIRMWVGLDQLYNIALSWKGVAKTLSSLPFGGEGRSGAHVMIQQPRSLKYHKPSVASQWDRFKEIYASSNLSPILSRPHPPGHAFLHLPVSLLSRPLVPFDARYYGKSGHGQNVVGPDSLLSAPTVLSQHRDVFFAPVASNGLPNFPQFENVKDPMGASKLWLPQTSGHSSPNSNPEERLTALLGLLRTLGTMHAHEVSQGGLETDD